MGIFYTTVTGAQDGYFQAGAWYDTLDPLRFVNLATVGLQFYIHDQFDSESRPLDPALPYPSFDLTLNASQISLDTTLDIYFVPEAAPEPYSTALAPTYRDEVFLLTEVWEAPVPLTPTASSITITIPTVLMVPYLRSSSWNGIISLSIEPTGAPALLFPTWVHSSLSTQPTLAPKIVTTDVPFHTGFHEGPAMGRRARLRHCPRTGMPVASDELVRDGYVEGLMVSPEGWEPEDPEDRYVPSPFEGVLDDEV